MRIKQLILSAAFGAATVLGASSALAASTMSVTYYTVPQTGNLDFGSGNNVPCCSYTFTSPATGLEVQSQLSNGLPVYNAGYGGPTLYQVDPITGELQWWSPSAGTGITETSTGSIVNVPISLDDANAGAGLFPNNGMGANDNSAFQTAIFRGELIVPAGGENVTFNLSSDDDSFLALGNTVIAQDGGVHPLGAGVSVTQFVAASTPITIFFADRHQTDSALDFSASATINAVPEPATWAMMLVGFGGLGVAMRRRRAVRALA